MKTTFVNKRSELTAEKDRYEAQGFDVYRTRMDCNCQPPKNRRYGIVVIDLTGHYLAKAVRCKACAKGGATW